MTKIYSFISTYRKYTVYLALVVYWIVLLALTSLPSKALPKVAFSDKVHHFLAFAVLAFLLFFAFNFSKKFRLSLNKILVITVCVVAFYGGIDELHQYFIPGRYAEWFDWLADIIGGVLGAASAYYLTLKGEMRSKT